MGGALGKLAELAAKHPEIVDTMGDAANAALQAKDLHGAWIAARTFFLKEAGKKIAQVTAAKLQQARQKLGK